MNIGAEYVLPYYKNLKFGLLSSTHFNKPFYMVGSTSFSQCSPGKMVCGFCKLCNKRFGSSLGWVLNFHPSGFNFFIGTDHMITKVTPQYVPVGNA